VQVGGPLGAYFPRAMFDTPLGMRSSAAKDGLIGHAGLVVFDDTADMLQQARFAMEFCAIESCGKCTPCRIGAVRGVERWTASRAATRAAEEPAVLTDLQHDEGRLALRPWRLHPLPGDERADPFPR
jgi:formate dehydrogenase iron-sulfur subunit